MLLIRCIKTGVKLLCKSEILLTQGNFEYAWALIPRSASRQRSIYGAISWGSAKMFFFIDIRNASPVIRQNP